MHVYEFDESATPPETRAYTRCSIESEHDEAVFETWLNANPDVILDEPILVFGRQCPLETGTPDLIGLDQFGNVVVFELKTGRSGSGSASEETILSQPQNYAQSLHAYGYSALDEIYQQYRAGFGESVPPATPETLDAAFEARFGSSLPDGEYNTHQRLVVVAEEVTRRTAENARYLLKQGLHFQCVEVQWFKAPEAEGTKGSSVLTSSRVVDYDRRRVRPSSRESPTYPDLVGEIVESVFPSIATIVNAETPLDVFPDGFDVRGPALESCHPDHPEGVVYGLAVKPDHDEVLLTIDNLEEKPAVPERIQSERATFLNAGFRVKDNVRYRLVEEKMTVESVADVRDRIPEIEERFETLVRLGHAVLVDSVDRT